MPHLASTVWSIIRLKLKNFSSGQINQNTNKHLTERKIKLRCKKWRQFRFFCGWNVDCHGFKKSTRAEYSVRQMVIRREALYVMVQISQASRYEIFIRWMRNIDMRRGRIDWKMYGREHGPLKAFCFRRRVSDYLFHFGWFSLYLSGTQAVPSNGPSRLFSTYFYLHNFYIYEYDFQGR